MNDERFKENSYEQALIELFKHMDYEYEYGPDIDLINEMLKKGIR